MSMPMVDGSIFQLNLAKWMILLIWSPLYGLVVASGDGYSNQWMDDD